MDNVTSKLIPRFDFLRQSQSPAGLPQSNGVTTRYGLLHYANLIRRTGPYLFSLQPT
jgi:hypothetical protein